MSFGSPDSGGLKVALRSIARSLFGETAMLNVMEMLDAFVAVRDDYRARAQTAR